MHEVQAMRTARWAQHVRRENVRLTAHFDAVIEQLQARDVSGFDASRRALRQLQIARLRAYRDGQRFPRNEGQRASKTPIFQDRAGTWCAMGQLIAESGAEAYAREVTDRRNLATITALTDDPRLHQWLHAHGLSVEEAARIQPGYYPTEPAPCICDGVGADTVPLRVEVRTTEANGDGLGVVVEAHGEGFEAGDEVVLSANWAFGPYEPGQYVALGSVTSYVENPWEPAMITKALPISQDGRVSCPDSYPGGLDRGICRDPSLSYAQTIGALTSADCLAYLASVDEDWTRPCPTSSGCASSPGAPAVGSAVSLAVLVVGLRAWSRRKAFKTG